MKVLSLLEIQAPREVLLMHWLVFKIILVTSKLRRLKYTHCIHYF